jgi:type I restriction enzyme S subunit
MAVFLTYLKNGRFQKIATITVNIAHLGAGRFAGLEFPLPPLEEQKEIVAEVNRRLSLLKAIESLINSNLKRSGRLRQSILKRAFEGKLVPQDPNDEPVSVLLERIRSAKGAAAGPQDAVSAPRSKESRKVFIRRAAVVSYTIRRLAGHKSFGRTQLEKTLHLTQSHLGVDLELVFERYKAGPFDKTIYKLEAVAKKNDWFTTQGRNGPGVTYHPGTKIDDACKYAGGILGRKQADLDRLLDHISKMDTDQAELFATAYAAWNDLLIDGRPADDLAIAAEIHGWHESKKRFTGKGLLLASAGCVSTDMCPPAKDSGRQ